jgi:hypothetical protein
MVTSVTKGGTQKLAKVFKIVKTYWHDHSLENLWEALSDGAISFSIQFILGGNQFSEFSSKNLSP